jgi:hypothetical protein
VPAAPPRTTGAALAASGPPAAGSMARMAPACPPATAGLLSNCILSTAERKRGSTCSGEIRKGVAIVDYARPAGPVTTIAPSRASVGTPGGAWEAGVNMYAAPCATCCGVQMNWLDTMNFQ